MTDLKKIKDYIQREINPYGKPFQGSVHEFGLKIMKYIDSVMNNQQSKDESVKGDLISRSALIESLKVHFDAFYREDGKIMCSDHICTSEDCDDLIKFVQNQPTVSNDGWIPCSEKYPPIPKSNPLLENKPLGLYLVTVTEEGYPFRAFWNGSSFTDGMSILTEVIAWQPLPQPYREE